VVAKIGNNSQQRRLLVAHNPCSREGDVMVAAPGHGGGAGGSLVLLLVIDTQRHTQTRVNHNE